MENVNEAVYTAVYTLIFIMALSLTIFLFSSLMSYSDEAYDYMHKINNNGVMINGSVNRNLILNGSEVVSYYFNYINKDKYINGNYPNNTTVKINLNTRNESPSWINSNLSYQQAIEQIGFGNKYILKVDEESNENNTIIILTKATEEELQEEW